MRALLWVAGVLVLLAGTQLFVFTERTATYFAWTINPPLTAAFLGAAYWSAAAFEWSAATRRVWADARVAVPAVFAFTVLTLIATLVHLDKFHLGSSFDAGTQAVTWIWIAIYTIVPVLMLVLWVRQSRAPGIDPPRTRRLPSWLRVVVAAQALALLMVGVGLFLAPHQTADLWPWTLTPLTARAVGAWSFSLGLAAAHVLVEDDARRIQPAAIAYLIFGGLELVSVLRYADDGDWSGPAGVAYLVFLVSSVVTGACATWLGRSQPGPAGASEAVDEQAPVSP
ncbi:MAG: hypothetical protein ACXWA3_01130 [Acidimicrobiales bacterium]